MPEKQKQLMRLEVEGPCSLQFIQRATLNLNLHLQPCDFTAVAGCKQTASFACSQEL